MRILELCAGYGGIGLGLQIAMPQTCVVGVVERQAYCAAGWMARMEAERMGHARIWPDLESFAAVVAPRIRTGFADLVCAGIPCQPWSTAGSRRGMEDERWIWRTVRRIIALMRPRIVFIENVPGLRRSGGLATILGDFARLGYDAEWDCFTASEVGANHQRDRLWILAYTDSIGPFWRGPLRSGRTESAYGYATDSHGFGCAGQPNNEGQQAAERGRIAETIAADADDFDGSGKRFGGCAAELHGAQGGASPDPTRGGRPSDGRTSGQSGHAAEFRSDATGARLEIGDGLYPGWPAHSTAPTFGWWDAEPDMGFLVDGRPARLGRLTTDEPERAERLHALGNGVVPLQAAYAFTILSRRAGLMK